MQVLEGGPYFFSRRYLVLTEWKRMLAPSRNQPSSIPVWVKIHKLPLECWTESGLSRVVSAIGKPIHVDKATDQKQRLDYARICVEIEAGEELPEEIQVRVNGEYVLVHLEYQWMPPKCDVCKVFGHSCRPKYSPNPSSPNSTETAVGKGEPTAVPTKPSKEDWQVVGRTAAFRLGGLSALEAVTKFVPLTSNTAKGEKSSVSVDDSEELDDNIAIIESIKPIKDEHGMSNEVSLGNEVDPVTAHHPSNIKYHPPIICIGDRDNSEEAANNNGTGSSFATPIAVKGIGPIGPQKSMDPTSNSKKKKGSKGPNKKKGR